MLSFFYNALTRPHLERQQLSLFSSKHSSNSTWCYNVLPFLFKTFVRPQLEYQNEVWSFFWIWLAYCCRRLSSRRQLKFEGRLQLPSLFTVEDVGMLLVFQSINCLIDAPPPRDKCFGDPHYIGKRTGLHIGEAQRNVPTVLELLLLKSWAVGTSCRVSFLRLQQQLVQDLTSINMSRG